jgi:guanylate kinase
MDLTREEQNKIFILSAPSGTGKNTVISRLMQIRSDLSYSISITTRVPRGTEKNGVEYYFVDKEDFLAGIKKGDFLEYAPVLDRFYGTQKSEIRRILGMGKMVIMDIDIQGSFQLKEKYPGVHNLFLVPPSLEILRERLVRRKTEMPEQIDKRMELAKKEMEFQERFEKTFVNENLEHSVLSVSAYIDQTQKQST